MSRVYRATLKCSYADGTLVEPSLHYQTDLPPLGDEPDPDDVANGIYGVVGSAFLNATFNQITFNDLVVVEQTIPPAIGATGLKHVGLAGSFSAAAEDLPRELVGLVSIHSSTASRSARGHLFLPGAGDKSKLASRAWTSGTLANWQAFADLLDNSFDLGSITPTHVNPVVYSRTRHLRSQTPYTFRVISATAKSKPSYLRSRGTTP